MKSFKQIKKSTALSLALLTVAFTSNAQTYSTLRSGTWENTSNVWSLDGSTPCLCAPPANTSGADITINHNITSNSVLDFKQGSIVTITESIFTTNYKITNWNSTLTIDSSFLNLSGGGEIENKPTGSITLLNGSKITIAGNDDDDIDNRGSINICSSCCISVSNSFDNGGEVNGSGSITSDYEIDNKGKWSNSILWCAEEVSGLSMGDAECQLANDNCNQNALPVELTDFKGSYLYNKYVNLEWTTISEHDNDYFDVMKSLDGEVWTKIGSVDGVGNSTEKNCYSFEDNDLNFKLAYYKLIQVDVSGRESHSQTIMVKNETDMSQVILYPNPASKSSRDITISNLNPDEGVTSIVNDNGQVMNEVDIDGTNDKVQVNISNLPANIYFVNVKQCGNSKTMKLIVIE